MANNFKVIVPVYNAQKHVGGCLDSIKNQTYPNFKCVVINACSTDKSLKVIQEKILGDDRFVLINNETRKYGLENIIIGTQAICSDDEDIIIRVDGDDELFDGNVFSYINSVYEDKDIWMTYGQYVLASDNVEGSCHYVEGLFNRKDIDAWLISHLRTYKYWLFKLIKEEDFRDTEGNYFCFAEDRAVIYPMAEMAGNHIKFISKILYKYNNLSPLNEFRVNINRQLATEAYLRAKPSYLPLERKPE